MVRPPANTTLTLSHLIGISPAEIRCVLTPEQFARVGALLLQARPADAGAVCFISGALSSLADAKRNVPPVVALDGDLGDEPFLVIAGQQGALALLAIEGAAGFQARIFTNPDLADRAALVLAQFSDEGYSLDALCDVEAQRSFVGSVAALLVREPGLSAIDVHALMPDERPALELARAVAAASTPADLLRLPAVQDVVREAGFSALLVGSVDLELQQLQIIAADAPMAPSGVVALPPPLLGAQRAQRSSSLMPADTAALGAPLAGWANGYALTAVPLMRERRAWGLLLALSERSPAVAARATLNGLSALLVHALSDLPLKGASAAAPVLAAPAPPLNSGATGSATNGTLSLAARLSGGGRKVPSSAPAAQPGAPAPIARPVPASSVSERNESFLTNFSNSIRMPLRELRELITQVPAAGNLNEQQSHLIGQVVRLNSELMMLVNDLLALEQIRLQTAESLAPLRIDLLVEAAVGTQYAEFGRRGQHVITEIQPGSLRVLGAEEGLGRAVAALIDNAIKYSPAGAQIKVAVSHSRDDVVVSVHDNGLGLDEAELAQVFDPFYRAPTTAHLGVSGRGLGLTITKAVIEQLGGRVWATGVPGQGCAFAFSLPSV